MSPPKRLDQRSTGAEQTICASKISAIAWMDGVQGCRRRRARVLLAGVKVEPLRELCDSCCFFIYVSTHVKGKIHYTVAFAYSTYHQSPRPASPFSLSFRARSLCSARTAAVAAACLGSGLG